MQDKDENRRFTGCKSRFEDAVMYEKMPKMHFVEFRNTPKEDEYAKRIFAPPNAPQAAVTAHVFPMTQTGARDAMKRENIPATHAARRMPAKMPGCPHRTHGHIRDGGAANDEKTPETQSSRRRPKMSEGCF